MKSRRSAPLRHAVVPALLALAALAAPAGAQGINVYVNNEAVAFPGQPPVQSQGTVLVPLRGVFEKLGANVQYDGASKTIFATKGPTSVILTLGRSQASVNGTPRFLSVPAQAVAGTTLVPLRFVSEALGAGVKWDAATRSVLIDTTGAGTAPTPTPAQNLPTSGTLVSISASARSLSLRGTNGETAQYTLAPDALVLLRGTQGSGAVQVEISQLRPGDQITVRRDASNQVSVIEASYSERRGVVKAVRRLSSGIFLVTLTDDTIVEMMAGAPASMSGHTVAIEDIRPGESVVIRTNPQTQQGVSIAVVEATPTPTPTAPTQLSVSSLTHSATRSLRAGDVLTVTLRGTSGATGKFTIPGIAQAQSVAMRETASGVYTGTFTVPAGINVKGAAVLASLSSGGTTSTTLQAGTLLTIDSVGPTITSTAPDDDSVVQESQPLIYATYSDAGSGIRPASVLLAVDGKLVKPQAVTGAFVNYAPPAALAPGSHQVNLHVEDAAGNFTKLTWNFTVARSEALVRSVATNAKATPLNAGQTLQVTAEAAPGGTAVFDIGGTIKNVAMRETSPGVYVGSYVVKQGDSLAGAPVTVRFTGKDGRAVTQAAAQPVSIATAAPSAPVIDTPLEGASTGGRVTVSGKATPGTTVRISATWQGRLLFLPQQGNFAQHEVKVGTDGRWSVPDIDLPQPLGVSSMSYTVSAIAVDAAGQESDPATVTFKR